MKVLLALIAIMLNTSLIASSDQQSSHCPPDEVMTPCTCSEDIIFCGGKRHVDLQSQFQLLSLNLNASEKHFIEFYFNNNAVKELPEDAFADISIDIITIENAFSLKRIHTNAFRRTNALELYVIDSPVNNIAPDFDIFKAINGMPTLVEVILKRTNITVLPAHAFHSTPDNPIALQHIVVDGSLRTLSSNAFVGLESVLSIALEENFLDFIPANAFVIDANSEDFIEISLIGNRLNATSFASDAFSHINRSFTLYLQHNKMVYLDAKIFEPILAKGNKLRVGGNRFICDCKMYWIYANRDQFRGLIDGAFCMEVEKLPAVEEFTILWDYYEKRSDAFNEEKCANNI